jgi:hypothetical protein
MATLYTCSGPELAGSARFSTQGAAANRAIFRAHNPRERPGSYYTTNCGTNWYHKLTTWNPPVEVVYRYEDYSPLV